MPTQPHITLQERDGVLVIAVVHKLLDGQVCSALRDKVLDVVQHTPRPVVLDLHQVSYLPSLAIGALLSLRSDLEAKRCPMVLARVSQPVKKVLEITHLAKLLRVADSVRMGIVWAAEAGRSPRPQERWISPSGRDLQIPGQ